MKICKRFLLIGVVSIFMSGILQLYAQTPQQAQPAAGGTPTQGAATPGTTAQPAPASRGQQPSAGQGCGNALDAIACYFNGPVGAGAAKAYPTHAPADPAVLDHGRALYQVNCQFCHGADARGGDGGGPNLIRSDLVLRDQKGELIAQVVQNGRNAMPKFNLTSDQITDIAAFVHSFENYNTITKAPPSILVGDATAGKKYFDQKCSGCHSVTGDLARVGTKYADPRRLQNVIVAGVAGRGFMLSPSATTVAVILPSGEKVEGPLVSLDDFTVTLKGADGWERTFPITPRTKVTVHDPRQPHIDMIDKWDDGDIHNLTAYLTTIK